MKALHRPDLFCWSAFDEARNVDFNGLFVRRDAGNLVIDPMPLSVHDRAHIASLGGVAEIVITNSDHLRAAAELKAETGARVWGPAAERERLGGVCDRFVEDGDEPVPGVVAFAMRGSKTPGELALLVDGEVLVTGDLIRAHQAGSLMKLPDAKLQDPAAACASIRRLAALPGIESVLVGDGWPVVREGGARLRELAARLG